MTTEFILYASASAALITGIIAGVFMAFSDFVMRSLSAASPVVGIQSMQLINRKVYGSVFLVLLLGMAPVSAAIATYAYTSLSGPAASWLITGGAIYVLGVFVVTMAGNVPMNKRLDGMDKDTPASTAYWAIYAKVWTNWNHLRTVASAGSAFCYLVGALLLAQA